MNVYTERIKDSQDYLVFLPNTFQIFCANEYTLPIIQDINKGMIYIDAKEKYPELTEDMYTKIYSVFQKKTRCSNEKMPPDILYRLVINVSNMCNMGCKYCYANKGVYNSSQNLMSNEMAEVVLEKFYKIFNTIETIQLFGGEPCLNIPAIKTVCEYVERNNKTTEIGMVTNGTILTDELLQLIVKYNILVTISLDHENIHDILRPYNNSNNGTHTKL